MLPKEGLTAQRYFRTLQPLISDHKNGAATLALTLLHLWQAQSTPSLVEGRHVPNKALAGSPLVKGFAGWLAGLDTLTAAFWLSSAYARWVGKNARDYGAMFFTPPILSLRLIDNLITNGASLTHDVWLDPASGGAAFLAPVALRMAEALRAEGRSAEAILNHISRHILGNDIDRCLAEMSRQFLRMVLHKEIAKAGSEPKFRVTTGDALSDLTHLYGKVDVVICNPPYRKMKRAEVNEYRVSYEEVIAGQPNLYGLFFKLSLECVKPSGIAGLLTPTSYLSGLYFSSLRTYVGTHAKVEQMDIVPSTGAFFSVEQETAIAVLKRLPAGKAHTSNTRVFHYIKDDGFAELGTCTLPSTGEAWSVPRDMGDVALLGSLSKSPFRLIDYGYVARIGHFVWNRDTRETFRKPPRRKSDSIYPLIWSSDILNGGGFEHGRGLAGKASGKFVDMGTTTAGAIIRTSCVVLQRVTSTDQPRRLVGASLPQDLFEQFGGVVGENHVVFLVPTGRDVKLSTQLLAEVLRSETVDRLFRCISGAVNVSIYELSHLPMPDPTKLKAALAKHATIDAAVSEAFGLSAAGVAENV